MILRFIEGIEWIEFILGCDCIIIVCRLIIQSKYGQQRECREISTFINIKCSMVGELRILFEI